MTSLRLYVYSTATVCAATAHVRFEKIKHLLHEYRFTHTLYYYIELTDKEFLLLKLKYANCNIANQFGRFGALVQIDGYAIMSNHPQTQEIIDYLSI